MHFKLILILSLICCLLIGCTHVSYELVQAEQIMESRPDSALKILQQVKPDKYQSNSNRALYGLLLFQALEKTDKKMQPDSVIDFSISYFQRKNDIIKLAGCYFLKGHMFKHAQRYANATTMYLKALNCIQNKKEFYLLGKIYSDMGDVYSFQSNNKDALKKYQLSLIYLNLSRRKIDAGFVLLSIGRNHSINNNIKSAQLYFKQAIYKIKDSILIGAAFQEIGNNFHLNKQLDSAEYYLRKSLTYPYRSTNFAIRNYCLADVMFDKEQYEEANKYATIALKYEAGFFTQKECYRILVNTAYLRNDIHQMDKYMKNYQACSDSVLQIKSHTKIDILENQYNTTQKAQGTKHQLVMIISVLLIIVIPTTLLVLFLYKRNKVKKDQLYVFKFQLNKEQEFVCESLTKSIAEKKIMQNEIRKNATAIDRDALDKETYKNTLHFDNWDEFKKEMNHAFNNIIVTLNSEYPTITQKEITWCCFHLLDIPHADRMLLLDATSDSLYKLKQRLAHKLNLISTKDLDVFLKNKITLIE